MKNYKLVMKLDGTDVTRTVTVPPYLDFETLHNVINKIFGFDNSHPWQFSNADCTLRLYCEIVVMRDEYDGARWVTWPHLVELRDVFSTVGKRIDYKYDFGDGWRVTIRRAADPKSEAVLCEKTSGTYALDDIGGPAGLMSYRRRLAASAFDLPPDYDERSHDFSNSLLWWRFGCRAKREKFLAGPDKDEITGLLAKCVGAWGHDVRLTDNARYFKPEQQPLESPWRELADDPVRCREMIAKYDSLMLAWADVVSHKIMPFAESPALVKKVAVKLGLCSQDKKKVIVESQTESDVLHDYIVMMQDEGKGTLARRFVESAAKSGNEKDLQVSRFLKTYRYRALRVKNFISGLGVVVTDLLDGRDYLLVNVELAKNGGRMDYITLFGGVVDMGGFLASTASLVPYDLPNVESLIDGNLADLKLSRRPEEALTAEELSRFAAKMITDLVECGYTSRIVGIDK